MIVQKPKENQRLYKHCILLFQGNDFLDYQAHIQLSVTIAEFYPFLCHCVLCSPFEAQLFLL